MFKHILVAVDGSTYSQQALPTAIEVARKFKTANANNIDLIVMGSRGLSDAQGLLLGSVTHKVIQMANIPVLVDRTSGAGQLSAEAAPQASALAT